MGLANYSLIPAATLYLHPEGLTRAGLRRELQKIYTYPLTRIWEQGFFDGSFNRKSYVHSSDLSVYAHPFCRIVDPFFDVAEALCLERRAISVQIPQFSGFDPFLFVGETCAIDYDGSVRPEWEGITTLPFKVKQKVGTPLRFFKTFPLSDLDKLKDFRNFSYLSSNSSKNSVLSDWTFLELLELLDEPLPLDRGRDNFFAEIGRKDDRFYLASYERGYSNLLCESPEVLYDSFPQLQVDSVFDWSPNQGKINLPTLGSTSSNFGCYRWIRKGNRYFFDPATFDRIDTTSFLELLKRKEVGEEETKGQEYGGGYTDLLLTAEAIKRRAWALFSWSGVFLMGDFFKQYPFVREVYNQAVVDSHYSLYAKGRGLSYQDLLRVRATNPCLEDLAEPLL